MRDEAEASRGGQGQLKKKEEEEEDAVLQPPPKRKRTPSYKVKMEMVATDDVSAPAVPNAKAKAKKKKAAAAAAGGGASKKKRLALKKEEEEEEVGGGGGMMMAAPPKQEEEEDVVGGGGGGGGGDQPMMMAAPPQQEEARLPKPKAAKPAPQQRPPKPPKEVVEKRAFPTRNISAPVEQRLERAVTQRMFLIRNEDLSREGDLHWHFHIAGSTGTNASLFSTPPHSRVTSHPPTHLNKTHRQRLPHGRVPYPLVLLPGLSGAQLGVQAPLPHLREDSSAAHGVQHAVPKRAAPVGAARGL